METINFEKQNQNMATGKRATYVLGGLVYAGVIVVSVVLTAMFITGILPADAYGLRVLIVLAVCMVGLNAVALPLALHFWAVEGWHRGLAVTFYGIDMLILAVNIIVSFSTLSGHAPGWVQQYTPYSVGMLVFALASWGILKIVDPGERASLDLLKAQQSFRVKAIQQAAAYLDSTEGHDAIAKAAGHLIPELFNPESMKNKPRSWYGGIRSQNTPVALYNADVPAISGAPGEVPAPVPFGGNGHGHP